MRRRLTDYRGMTLVEMLVAIAMASILIAFFFQADVALRKSAYGWIKQASLEEAAILLRQRLSKDLLSMDSLIQADSKELRLIDNCQKTVKYQFDKQTITRNGQTILPMNVQLVEVKVQKSGVGSTIDLTIEQGSERHCRIALPIRPWKQRTLERSNI